MFDPGTARWNCWVCFAGSALQAVSPYDQIGIDLIHTTDHDTLLTHVFLGLLYFRLVKLECLIVVGDMVQESHSFPKHRLYICIYVTPESEVYK